MGDETTMQTRFLAAASKDDDGSGVLPTKFYRLLHLQRKVIILCYVFRSNTLEIGINQ